MNKLKEYVGYVVAFIISAFGVILFVMSRRGDKIEKLQGELAVAKTDKQVDLVEAQVNELKTDKNNLVKENDNLNKTMEEIVLRREEIKEEVKNLKDPKAIAQYWENN